MSVLALALCGVLDHFVCLSVVTDSIYPSHHRPRNAFPYVYAATTAARTEINFNSGLVKEVLKYCVGCLLSVVKRTTVAVVVAFAKQTKSWRIQTYLFSVSIYQLFY